MSQQRGVEVRMFVRDRLTPSLASIGIAAAEQMRKAADAFARLGQTVRASDTQMKTWASRSAWWVDYTRTIRRCRSCYSPMKYDFRCDWYECELCDTHVGVEELEDRPRWRRALDNIMGMDN
jgi:hypothetical protein